MLNKHKEESEGIAGRVVQGAKTAAKGGLVVFIIGLFGSFFLLFLTLLGLKKRPGKRKKK